MLLQVQSEIQVQESQMASSSNHLDSTSLSHQNAQLSQRMFTSAP